MRQYTIPSGKLVSVLNYGIKDWLKVGHKKGLLINPNLLRCSRFQQKSHVRIASNQPFLV